MVCRGEVVILRNEDIREITISVPEGHQHLRAVIMLQDNTEIVLQEAALANLVRGYVTVKTDPLKKEVRLTGRKLLRRKEGFAEWQLLEG